MRKTPLLLYLLRVFGPNATKNAEIPQALASNASVRGASWRTATVPSLTIEALHGVGTYVTWENHLSSKHILPWYPTIPTAIPATKTEVPTPGTLWYHDHVAGLIRVNLLAGLVGTYIVRHPEIEGPLKLPWGDEFDRPLFVFYRSFCKDGSIYMNSTGNSPSIHPQWQPEYFGDVIIMNGKAWPKMTKPVVTNETLLAPSEIADVVVDFSKSKTDEAVLANDAPYPYPSGDPVNELNDLSSATQTRYIAMYEYTGDTGEPTHLYINGKPYEAPATETPKAGTSEIWNVINLTEDNHPMHIHLAVFTVLDQTELVKAEEFKACMSKMNDAMKCEISK
ncbi:hypothetical protein PVK06_007795 [Gossypium arboreum]|uniref:Plastocyanin-like domain-containing protein n=1 Tax=Gossypium arboreum TaxID=29729 RepID=A0ABR0QIH7_GOSAR|nr:hypothetical protein PVK06_007795 [Gossypium arboreum]